MVSDSDHILHVTIWSKDTVLHRISCISVSPNAQFIITGSIDGNLFIWEFQQNQKKLQLRNVVGGQSEPVTTIACFDTFFIAFYSDGSIRHFELPFGNLLNHNRDCYYLHRNSSVLGYEHVVCSGYYLDLIIIDVFSLRIRVHLQSRLQSDWISCFKISQRDSCFCIQALNKSGVLKTWSLSNFKESVLLESSSGPLNVKQCQSMSFHMKRRLFLLVTSSDVTVFDRGLVILFQHESSVPLVGGDFINDDLVFWSKYGDVFIAHFADVHKVQKIIDGTGIETLVPLNSLLIDNGKILFISGDLSGSLNVYSFESAPSYEPNRIVCINIGDITSDAKGLLDHLDVTVTCSIHIANANSFIAGCLDGSILVYNANELISFHFLTNNEPTYNILLKHRKAVRCLLYPHSETNSYQEHLLVSGSDDFSVCLWDLSKLELLHQFCVHGGPVIRLLRSPCNANVRTNSTICSVSADHSVAILSIRDRRCSFLAGHHPFPVVAIRWKPLHDFIVVKLFDGSVFVWEMRTGVLDRVLKGVTADEVIYNCDDNQDEVLWDFYTNGPQIEEITRKPFQIEPSPHLWPIHIRGVMSSFFGEFHIMTINVSRLVGLLESCTMSPAHVNSSSAFTYLTKPPNTDGVQKKISGIIDAFKHEADIIQDFLHLSVFNSKKECQLKVAKKVSFIDYSDLISSSTLALSLLHSWGLDSKTDDYYRSIGGKFPKKAIQIDLVSKQDSFTMSSPSDTENEFSIERLVALSAVTLSLNNNSSMAENSENIIPWALVDLKNEEGNIVHVEKLATLWQSSSATIRGVVRNVLVKYMLNLKTDLSLKLLKKWVIYLPSADTNDDLFLYQKSIVIIGLLSIDVEVRPTDVDIVTRLCESLQFSISIKNSNQNLRAAAVDIIGRGYLLFEDLLPVDHITIQLLGILSHESSENVRCSAQSTLRIIAKARVDKFLAFIKFLCKTSHSVLESTKGEIISIIRDILVDPPLAISLLLSDIIEVLVSCIDQGHLRATELVGLLPGIKKLDQIDHNVYGQRLAVGMPDGKVVVHDLRFHRCHVFQAHSVEVSALRFSPDGKMLLTINIDGDVSLWQLSHGLFDLGVGQFRFRCVKQFPSQVDRIDIEKGIDIFWSSGHVINLIPSAPQGTPVTINLNV